MNRTLIFTIIIGVILLAGCGAPAAAPPAESATESVDEAPQATKVPSGATEPALVEPTAAFPSESTPTVAAAFTPQPAFPERRRLTLEFPPRIRAGDSDVVRLTLEVDDLGNITPTAEMGGNVVTGEVIEIPNLYESHHVIAEARFDIAGMEVRPPDLVSQPLTQGTSATFYWSIRPQAAGDYRGTIWLYLRFVDRLNGEESLKTVSAQIVEVEAVNLLGLSGAVARTTGVVGSIVGTVLGFPFLEDIVKFLFKRRRQHHK
ncbi:MAG: hypothetical protein JW730_02275 [Anaerolineales bacterium]|nr:hypothetical protein [Anaerolineales bacterium]